MGSRPSVKATAMTLWVCAALIAGLIALAGPPTAAGAPPVLRAGSKGPDVVLAQHLLIQLGLLEAPPDGIFGPATRRAVLRFQGTAGITADGVVGPQTWLHLSEAVRRAVETGVELLPWSEAQRVYSNFTVATVTDVRTGLTFQVRRYYGHHHADSEPLTAADTRVMRQIYGSGSWQRRPIIVEVDGRRIAASMNGMAHGDGSIEGNDFNGHFCIHFLGSRIHRTGTFDPEHHMAVLEAAGYRPQRLWLTRR